MTGRSQRKITDALHNYSCGYDRKLSIL